MSPSQASETCASASSATSAWNGLPLCEWVQKVSTGEEFVREGGVYYGFSDEICCCDAFASGHDHCSSCGCDGVASECNNAATTPCYVVDRDRPSVHHVRRGSYQTCRTSCPDPRHDHGRDPGPTHQPTRSI